MSAATGTGARPARAHLVHLDGIRGAAALAVVLYHLPWRDPLTSSHIARHAWLMVDFFFVLSGFVIALNYAGRISSPGQLGAFIWKRMARLYPLHLLMLLAFIALEFGKLLAFRNFGIAGDTPPFSGNTPASILPNLALLQGLGVMDHLTWNWPSWSISAEFYTYALFGLAILAARGRAWIVTGVCCVAAAVGPVALAALAPAKMLDVTFDFGFVRCILGFALGVLAYQAYRRWGEREAGPLAQAGQLAALAACLAMVYVGSRGDPITLAAPFLFMIMLGSLILWRGGAIERALSNRYAQRLGAWSYSIYMTHAFVIVLAQNGKPLIEGRWPWLVSAAVQPVWNTILTLAVLGSVLLISACTYHLFERPVQDRLLGLTPRLFKTPGPRQGLVSDA